MLPEDAADKRAQWSSSDNAIATVYDNSTVTAVGEVTANTTVTYVDRGKTAYGLVPMHSILVSGISMNFSAAGYTLRVPAASKAAYEADTDWRNTFTAITEI